jgi:hypothetical protein
MEEKVREYGYVENGYIEQIVCYEKKHDKVVRGLVITKGNREDANLVFHAYDNESEFNSLRFEFDENDMLYSVLDKLLSDREMLSIKSDNIYDKDNTSFIISKLDNLITLLLTRTNELYDFGTMVQNINNYDPECNMDKEDKNIKESLRTIFSDFKIEYNKKNHVYIKK